MRLSACRTAASGCHSRRLHVEQQVAGSTWIIAQIMLAAFRRFQLSSIGLLNEPTARLCDVVIPREHADPEPLAAVAGLPERAAARRPTQLVRQIGVVGSAANLGEV